METQGFSGEVGDFITFKGKRIKEEVLGIYPEKDSVVVRRSCCCGKPSKNTNTYSFETLNQMIDLDIVKIKKKEN